MSQVADTPARKRLFAAIMNDQAVGHKGVEAGHIEVEDHLFAVRHQLREGRYERLLVRTS